MHQQWLDMADSYTRVRAQGGDPLRQVMPTAQFVDPNVALEFIPHEWAERQQAREQLYEDPVISSLIGLHDSWMDLYETRNQGPLAQFRPNMPDTERQVLANQLTRLPMPDEVQQQILDGLNYAQNKLQEIDGAMNVETDGKLSRIFHNMGRMAERSEKGVFDVAPPTPSGDPNVFHRLTAAALHPVMDLYAPVADGVMQIGFAMFGALDSRTYDEYRKLTFAGNHYISKDGKLVHDGGKVSPQAGPRMMLQMLAGDTTDQIIQHGLRYDENFDWQQAQVKPGLETYANATAQALGFLAAFMGTGGGMSIQLASRMMTKGAANLITSGHKSVRVLGHTLARVGGAGLGTAAWEMGVNGRVDGYAQAAIEGMKMGPVFALAGFAGGRLGKYLDEFQKMPPRLAKGMEGMLEGFVISQSDLAHLQGAAWNFMRDPTDPEKMRTWAVGVVSSMVSFGMFKAATGQTPGEMSALRKILSPEEWKSYRKIVTENEALKKQALEAKSAAQIKASASALGVRPQRAQEYGQKLREHAAGKISGQELSEYEVKVRAEQYVRDTSAQERATERMHARELIQRLKDKGPHGKFDTPEKLAAEIKGWEEILEMAAEPEGAEVGDMVTRRRRRPAPLAAEVIEGMLKGRFVSKGKMSKVARELAEARRFIQGEEPTAMTQEYEARLEQAWKKVPRKFQIMAEKGVERRAQLPPLPRGKVTQRAFESVAEYEKWQAEGETIVGIGKREQQDFIQEMINRVATAMDAKGTGVIGHLDANMIGDAIWLLATKPAHIPEHEGPAAVIRFLVEKAGLNQQQARDLARIIKEEVSPKLEHGEPLIPGQLILSEGTKAAHLLSRAMEDAQNRWMEEYGEEGPISYLPVRRKAMRRALRLALAEKYDALADHLMSQKNLTREAAELIAQSVVATVLENPFPEVKAKDSVTDVLTAKALETFKDKGIDISKADVWPMLRSLTGSEVDGPGGFPGADVRTFEARMKWLTEPLGKLAPADAKTVKDTILDIYETWKAEPPKAPPEPARPSVPRGKVRLGEKLAGAQAQILLPEARGALKKAWLDANHPGRMPLTDGQIVGILHSMIAGGKRIDDMGAIVKTAKWSERSDRRMNAEEIDTTLESLVETFRKWHERKAADLDAVSQAELARGERVTQEVEKELTAANIPLIMARIRPLVLAAWKGDLAAFQSLMAKLGLESHSATQIERIIQRAIRKEMDRDEGGDLPPGVVGMAQAKPGERPTGVPPKHPGTPASLDLKAQQQMAEHPAAAALIKKWGAISQQDIHLRMEGQEGDPVRLAMREGVAIKGIGTTKQWLGWYDRRQHLSRLRDMRLEAAKVHEWSHAMEEMAIKRGMWDPQNLEPWMAAEFARVAETYPGYNKLSKRDQIAEGWAEFWAREALDDPRLPIEVPRLYKWLMDWISKPQAVSFGFERQFTEIQELMRLWRMMGATKRVQSLRERVGQKKTVMEIRDIRQGKGLIMSAAERVLTLGSKYLADNMVELRKAWKKSLRIAGIEEADLPPSLNPVSLFDYFAMTSSRQAEQMWNVGTHDISGNRTGISATDILGKAKKLAGGDINPFIDYLVARRMINRIDQGEEMPGRREDLIYDVERLQIQYPEFITYADQFREFSMRVLDYAVQAGSLSRAEANHLLKTDPIYIPFQRIMDFAGGKAGKGRGTAERGIGVAPMKGGPEQLKEPIQAMKDSIQSIITKAQQTMVMRSMYLTQKMQIGMGGFVNEVPRGVEPREVLIERIEEEIVRLGRKKGRGQEARELADKLEELLGDETGATETALTFWFQKVVPSGSKPIIAFRPKFTTEELHRLVPAGMRPTKRGFKELREEIAAEEGEIIWLEVVPDAYNALMGVDQAPMLMENAPAMLRGLVMGPVQMVRLGATIINPSFIIRNLIRDPLTRQMFTKSKGRDRFFFGLSALWSGAAESMKRDKIEGVKILDALGLEGSTRVGFVTEAQKSLEKGGIIGGPLRSLRWLAEKMGKPETWLRTREFLDIREAALKRGASEVDATIEAGLAYKEVTVNFTRTGIWGRQISQLIPYFSPRVAGLRKYWRTVLGAEGKGPQTQALLRGFTNLGGLSAMAWWLGRNEEWYQDLPLWRKVNYWNVKFGDTVLSFSKPFEAGILMGSTVENALTAFDDYDPEMLEEIMLELFAQHIVGWPIIPQPVLPFIESGIWSADSPGYSYFTGSPVVPEWMLKTRVPDDQYNAYTTETFKWLGDAFGLSPTKLEYMVNQYTGGLAKRVLATGEQLIGWSDAEWRMSSIPGIGTLFSQSEHRFSRAEDTIHDIDFQLGRMSGSGLLTGSGRAFQRKISRARERLRRLRQQQRDGRFTAEEANRRAYLLTHRLAEQWERTKMSQYRRETPRRPR